MNVKYPVLICKLKRLIHAMALIAALKSIDAQLRESHQSRRAGRRRKQVKRLERLIDYGDPWNKTGRA